MSRIIIGADIVPTQSNIELFIKGDIGALIGSELVTKLKSADFTIFNLEVPLADEAHPISKCGPNLIAPTETITGLKAINPHFFTLANNHILDQGREGMQSTIALLNEAGIKHAGAGKNLQEASKTCVAKVDGQKIGIYCCAEHEFTIATDSRGGANPFDPLESPDHINRLKAKCDYVIVLYHGGKEHYRYPSPNLQKVCRKLVEKGADLVVCQHSHCIGCEETWRDGTIIYGQGNFIFDGSESEFWQTSLLIEVILGEKAGVKYLPIIKQNNLIRLADSAMSENILLAFEERSNEVKNPMILEAKYDNFAKEMSTYYLSICAGKNYGNFIYRAVNKLTRHRFIPLLEEYRYRGKAKTALQNIVECESHRELWIRGMLER